MKMILMAQTEGVYSINVSEALSIIQRSLPMSWESFPCLVKVVFFRDGDGFTIENWSRLEHSLAILRCGWPQINAKQKPVNQWWFVDSSPVRILKLLVDDGDIKFWELENLGQIGSNNLGTASRRKSVGGLVGVYCSSEGLLDSEILVGWRWRVFTNRDLP